MIVGQEDSSIKISGIFFTNHGNTCTYGDNQNPLFINEESVSEAFYIVTISTDFGKVLLAEYSGDFY